MAGRFEGLSDLEWRLFVDIMPPEPTKRGRGMPHTPFRKVVNTLLYLLITGCRWCDTPRGPLGFKECGPSLVAALAGRWHLGSDASPGAGAGRGTRDDSLGVWRRGWRFFPLARVGARASPVGAKARGSSSTVSRRARHALGEPYHAGQWG